MARSVPRRPGSESSQRRRSPSGSRGSAVRQSDGIEVLEQPDGARQEVVVGADFLFGDRLYRAEQRAAGRERVQAGAVEREDKARGEDAARRRYNLPGAGRT